jgi:hypothetical protein
MPTCDGKAQHIVMHIAKFTSFQMVDNTDRASHRLMAKKDPQHLPIFALLNQKRAFLKNMGVEAVVRLFDDPKE